MHPPPQSNLLVLHPAAFAVQLPHVPAHPPRPPHAHPSTPPPRPRAPHAHPTPTPTPLTPNPHAPSRALMRACRLALRGSGEGGGGFEGGGRRRVCVHTAAVAAPHLHPDVHATPQGQGGRVGQRLQDIMRRDKPEKEPARSMEYFVSYYSTLYNVIMGLYTIDTPHNTYHCMYTLTRGHAPQGTHYTLSLIHLHARRCPMSVQPAGGPAISTLRPSLAPTGFTLFDECQRRGSVISTVRRSLVDWLRIHSS